MTAFSTKVGCKARKDKEKWNICEQNKDIPKGWLFKHFKIQEGWIIYDYNVLFLCFTKTLLSKDWEVLFLIEKVNLL